MQKSVVNALNADVSYVYSAQTLLICYFNTRLALYTDSDKVEASNGDLHYNRNTALYADSTEKVQKNRVLQFPQ